MRIIIVDNNHKMNERIVTFFLNLTENNPNFYKTPNL